MQSWVERLLSLRRGDLGRGSLLFAYYFLIVASYVVGQVARDALFLERFDANRVPYANVAIAALVAAAVAVYVRFARRYALAGLVSGSLTVFALIAFLFWWAFAAFRWDWLFAALYIWVGIFGVLAITQVWTLANFVLTTREAKRIFGLIGGGGILGGIFGGFVSTVLAGTWGTESLLPALGTALAACAVLVVFISRWYGEDSEAPGDRTGPRGGGPVNLRESLRLVRGSAHLRSIAALICIASVVTTAAGWQFMAVAKEYWADTDQLAVFFGSFGMYAGILSFAAQLFLTSRMLGRFGVGVALLVLPGALALGSAGVLMWGNLYAVTFLRGSDKVLRYSIDTAALQLLYLPVPAGIKIQVKSFIDTVVWRFGDGLAGLVLLVFATWLEFTPREIGWVILAFIGGWIFVALRARTEYLRTLADRLRKHRIDSSRAAAPVLDRSTTSMLAAKLLSDDTEEILYGLSLFETGYHQAAHPAMRGLIRHRSPEVRARALGLLNAAGDDGIAGEVEALLHDGDVRVRTEALAYLTRRDNTDPLERIREFGDFPEYAIRSSVAAFLARPGPGQNPDVARMLVDSMLGEDGPDRQAVRFEAARLIAAEPEAFQMQLPGLFDDDDPEIVRLAIEGAVRLGRLEFCSRLLGCLGDPGSREAAKEALVGFGNRIAGTLEDYLRDPEMPMEIRREIPGILLGIGTSEAQRALIENLFEGDTALRFRIIAALNKFQKDRPELRIDRQLLETVLAAELLGHYRSYQAFEALQPRLDRNDPAAGAFRESLDKEVERIFRLLGLMYPEHDFHAVHAGLGSGDPRLHDNALEFLESVLRPELRALLLPLVDAGVSVRERTERATRLVGQEVATAEDAVRMLVASGDPWLRSCAAYAIGALGLTSLGRELDRMQADPDPLLAATVRQARSSLAAAARKRG